MPSADAMRSLLQSFVDSGRVLGAIGVSAGQGEPETVAVDDLAPDAIVRIQSMTKAVTAVATLRLIEAGTLSRWTHR